MLLSIVIPTINRQKYLKQTVEHLNSPFLSSLDKNEKEVIIVDSTKNNGSLNIDDFADYIYVNEPDLNAAEARQFGANLSKGKFVLQAEDDTLIRTQNGLDLMIEKLQKYPEVGLVGGLDTMRARGLNSETAKKYPEGLMDVSFIGWAVMMRKSIYDYIKYDSNFPFYEHADFAYQCWLAGYRVCLTTNVKVNEIREPNLNIVNARKDIRLSGGGGPNSITGSHSPDWMVSQIGPNRKNVMTKLGFDETFGKKYDKRVVRHNKNTSVTTRRKYLQSCYETIKDYT
jgi:glycosyltransferase involved in cell wall biosynthesis